MSSRNGKSPAKKTTTGSSSSRHGHHHHNSSSSSSSSSSIIPQTRQVEFRSVLRLRPSLPVGEGGRHSAHARCDDDEILLTEAPPGTVKGADPNASAAILRRPQGSSASATGSSATGSSATASPRSKGGKNGGSSSSSKSTLQYGMSMLRGGGGGGGGHGHPKTGSSPMGKLASLTRHAAGGRRSPLPSSSSAAAGGAGGSDNGDGNGDDVGISYQFDAILDPNTTQTAAYDSIGAVAVLDVTEPLLLSSDTTTNSHSHSSNSSSNNNNNNKDHVIFTLGTTNSGKTHTAIGSGGEGCVADDNGRGQGLAPRLIDDLFRTYERSPSLFNTAGGGGGGGSGGGRSKSSNSSASLSYALRLTMVHVHGNKVYDMLSASIADPATTAAGTTAAAARLSHISGTSSVKKLVASMENSSSSGELSRPDGDIQEVRLVKSSKTGLFRADANVETCREFMEAQETLYDGLDEVVVDGEDNVIKRSRGHTLITVQPVLVDGDDEVRREGGKITIVDLAVNEASGGGSSRRGVGGGGAGGGASASSSSSSSAKNVTVTAVLECLGSIKRIAGSDLIKGSSNSSKKKTASKDEISYRENKLTMLVQPLFSNGRGVEERKTVVTLVVAASQGGRDYSEKKTLLGVVESLRGTAAAAAAHATDDKDEDSFIKPTVGLAMTPPKAPAAPASTPRVSNISPAGQPYESAHKSGKKKELHTAAAAAAAARSPLPPTHPRSAKKNPFALTDATNADTPDHASAAAGGSSKKSKSPANSPKKKDKSKPREDEEKRTPSKGAASRSWLDISQDVPPVGAKVTHLTGNVPNNATESYSRKIMGLVDRSPLRKVGHAVSGASSSITGTTAGGTKRLRPAASRDEDDGLASNDQQRKVSRKLEKDNIRLQDRVMHLEEDREALRRKNYSLEQKCKELTRENGNLVRLLEETKRNAYRSGMQQYAEQEAEKEEAEREARISDQALLKSPLMSHMKHVMQTSNEQMAWQLQDKPHYSLNVPHKEAWTCSDLYKHQKSSNVITEMGNALARSLQEGGDAMDEEKERSAGDSIVTGTF